MPRIARPVFSGVPHHIAQRGNRREKVFFSDEDRAAYLDWLREYCVKHGVEVLAYCLMAQGDRWEQLEVLRRHVERGLPCGSEGFLRKLEQRAGQMLRWRARGRPKTARG